MLLDAGVAVSGSHYLRAAIDLLTFTEPPERADLAAQWRSSRRPYPTANP